MTICPVCDKDDQAQRVSGVLDSGTTNMTGESVTRRAVHRDIVTTHSTTSLTNLARRLTPPARPSIGLAPRVVVITSIITLVMLGGHALGGVLLGVIVIGLAIWRWIVQAGRVQRYSPVWQSGYNRLRAGYYCARDDIAFDGKYQGPAEGFVRACFAGMSQPAPIAGGAVAVPLPVTSSTEAPLPVPSSPAIAVLPAHAPTSSATDPAHALQQLKSLHEQGFLTEDEYVSKRAQILDRL